MASRARGFQQQTTSSLNTLNMGSTGNSRSQAASSSGNLHKHHTPYPGGHSGRNMYIRATSFAPSMECPMNCRCRCHQSQSRQRGGFKTPDLLGKFLGSLQIGYQGVPIITATCDRQECKAREKSRVTVNYQFPEWFWQKKLLFSVVNHVYSGPEILLRVKGRLENSFGPYNNNYISIVCSGNFKDLQKLITEGTIGLYDEDERGWSLLDVGDCLYKWVITLLTSCDPS